MIELRPLLRLDAVACAAAGVVLTVGGPFLAEPLGLPAPLLLGLGFFLLGYAVALELIARRRPPARGAVLAVVVGNLLWALAGVGLVLIADLTTLGVAVVLGQAVAVAAVAQLEYVAVRRGPAVRREPAVRRRTVRA